VNYFILKKYVETYFELIQSPELIPIQIGVWQISQVCLYETNLELKRSFVSFARWQFALGLVD